MNPFFFEISIQSKESNSSYSFDGGFFWGEGEDGGRLSALYETEKNCLKAHENDH